MEIFAPIRSSALLALAAILLACNQPAQPTPPEPPETVNGYRVDGYMITVPIAAGDTPASLAAEHGGTMEIWDAESPDPSAILRVTRRADAPGLPQPWPNLRMFETGGARAWVNGRARVWAGGRARVWAGGNVWSSGTYNLMPENSFVWNLIGLADAHRRAPRLGQGVTVAVVDTGIDLGHPAFDGALSAKGWDYVEGDASPQEAGRPEQPGYGHGTSVAGIVRQIAPNVTLMPLRVMDAEGSGNVVDVAKAIRYAAQNGARVINLSLGAAESHAAIEQAILFANRRGVFVVASVGNEGNTRVTYPARDFCVACKPALPFPLLRVSVGSTQSTDLPSSFSNRNSPAENYMPRVSLAAPGEGLRGDGDVGEGIHGPFPGGQQAAWSGTSMAAPVVSGALALALAEESRWGYGVSRETLYTWLAGTSNPVRDPNPVLGVGRVHLERFINLILVQD